VPLCDGCESTHPNTAPAPTKQSATISSSPRLTDALPESDLRLFGREDAAQDVAFEAKAALDLEQHTFPDEGADFDPDVDPAGKLLVFASTRHSRHSHLYTKPIGGAVITQITDEDADDVQPAICPSGKRIAYASNRAGQWDIWLIDANGKNPTQVTSSPMPEMRPSWSPDGRRLIYCRLTSNQNHGDLWVVDLLNPGVKRCIGEGLFPDWSPRGDKIAYQRARHRGSGWFSIWTLDFQDDEVLFPTEIASSSQCAYICPTWSVDGRQIAFTAVPAARATGAAPAGDRPARGSRSDILIVDVDGRGLQRLTDGQGENNSPAWAADGRIFYTAKTAKTETIWSVKPFKPSQPAEETPITTGDRRAAQVLELDD
jgi:TolB protein